METSQRAFWLKGYANTRYAFGAYFQICSEFLIALTPWCIGKKGAFLAAKSLARALRMGRKNKSLQRP